MCAFEIGGIYVLGFCIWALSVGYFGLDGYSDQYFVALIWPIALPLACAWMGFQRLAKLGAKRRVTRR